jgi:PhnB protein
VSVPHTSRSRPSVISPVSRYLRRAGADAHTSVDAARELAWSGPDDPGDWRPVTRTFRDGHAETWRAAGRPPDDRISAAHRTLAVASENSVVRAMSIMYVRCVSALGYPNRWNLSKSRGQGALRGQVVKLPGMTGIQPELWVDRAAEAIAFYVAAFGARVLHQVGEGDDVVAQLAVGNAAFWVSPGGADGPRFSPRAIGGATGRTLLVADDPDALFAQAVAAGAAAASEMADEHGWRLGPDLRPVRSRVGNRQAAGPLAADVTGATRRATPCGPRRSSSTGGSTSARAPAASRPSAPDEELAGPGMARTRSG